VFFLVAAFSGLAGAATIDFNSHIPAVDGGNPILDSGYTFDFAASGWGVFEDSFVGGGAPYVRNGTTRLFAQGNNASVEIFATDSSVFSFDGFDTATTFDYFSSGNMQVTGNISGGGTISQTFQLTNSFASYSLGAGWSNLSSVIFQDLVSGSWTSSSGFSLDNLIINEGSATIPEPATMILFGFGLIGLAGVSRRKK